jgi:hypothetical protein
MTCRKARKALPLFAGGDLPAQRASRIEVHVASCPSCRRELEEFRAALGRARSAARAEKTGDWGEAEWTALMGRITARRPAAGTAAVAGRGRWKWAAGLATIVLLAALAILLKDSLFRGGRMAPAPGPMIADKGETKTGLEEPGQITPESPRENPARRAQPEYSARNVDKSRPSREQVSIKGRGSSEAAAAEAGQDVLSVTMVSQESGLQVVWFFDKNFEWKGDLE